ncbi:MAG: hypothetical protein H8M99_04860 [Gloeobacteraceae cyanobacterium ES-bin-144]|nr:hypothetical protein [Verrucomicrobiales bacterium]
MKRKFAWLLAIGSGLYVLIGGPLPDPLPLLDEATALLIFVKAMSYLGYDVSRWITFLKKGKGTKTTPQERSKDVTIDV